MQTPPQVDMHPQGHITPEYRDNVIEMGAAPVSQGPPIQVQERNQIIFNDEGVIGKTHSSAEAESLIQKSQTRRITPAMIARDTSLADLSPEEMLKRLSQVAELRD